jgi:hypothetical protein
MGKEITFDKFIRWAGVTLIVLAVLYMTNYLSSVLLPFFIAWFFAYLLYPVVKFIENKLHVRIRALSILIAMGTAIAVIGGVLWLIIPPMIDQFDKLGEVLTRWLHQTTHTNNLTALIKDFQQTQRYYNTMLGHYGAAPAVATPELCEEVVRKHLQSNSILAILSLQDWMSMDGKWRNPNAQEERINVPANPRHYWRWRMHLTLEQLMKAESLNEKIKELIAQTGR